ncbi:GntR family transcriptional regulator [Sphingopyxis sp.]|uniref:GntR family transcriptional regulator n=1 Tax=Sphingopyxis sp. TaxID=1908224 RepID=UPI002B460412|nr:GntR family transcriptional regulator [Sphingopyxis sp.]HJS09789.1 GntR family transcriptional regulator [Sphingopyxis sp.]
MVADAGEGRLKNASLSDLARDRLRAAIMEGKLRPGEKINIERVSEMFGISRTPVREALKALEMEGMVRIEAHRGAIVEPLAWREIDHRYAIRSMLEGYAAEQACLNRGPEIASVLEKNCSRVRREIESPGKMTPKKLRTIAELNNEFHRTIWLASGSLTLIRFLDSLELPRSFSDSFWTEGDYRELVCSHHEEIAAAFGAGDSTAVRHLMERHMLASADMIASAAHADHESARAPICC